MMGSVAPMPALAGGRRGESRGNRHNRKKRGGEETGARKGRRGAETNRGRGPEGPPGKSPAIMEATTVATAWWEFPRERERVRDQATSRTREEPPDRKMQIGSSRLSLSGLPPVRGCGTSGGASEIADVCSGMFR